MNDEEQPKVRLYEAPCRVSRSALWRLQRESYQEVGPDAWGPAGVPLQIVANPWIADAYAQVIVAHLRAQADAPGDQPVYIVELGAGSGRFAHYLLQALTRRTARGPASRPWRVVLTDLAASNVRAWRRHPQLSAWFEAGLLDATVFDASAPAPIELSDGTVLGPGRLSLPPVFIANYLFDSLPTDGFWVGDGERHELLLGLITDRAVDEPVAFGDTAWLRARVQAPRPSYEDPLLERLLEEHAAELDQTSFLVPIAAIGCLDHLRTWADGWVLLMSDKGDVSTEGIHGRDHLNFVSHDLAFSTLVNFELLGRWVKAHGGTWETGRGEQLLVTALSTRGLTAEADTALHEAYQDALYTFSPMDHQRLVQGLASVVEQIDAGAVLSVLRLTCYDPHIFHALRPALLRDLRTLVALPPDDVQAALDEVWARRFALPDAPQDLAFEIATVLHAARLTEEAIPLYQRSLAETGSSVAGHYNLGLALEAIGRLDEAYEQACAALDLGTGIPEVKHLHQRLAP
jgi:tetratricopeptide (TPR) repeat protein